MDVFPIGAVCTISPPPNGSSQPASVSLSNGEYVQITANERIDLIDSLKEWHKRRDVTLLAMTNHSLAAFQALNPKPN